MRRQGSSSCAQNEYNGLQAMGGVFILGGKIGVLEGKRSVGGGVVW
jgi:hypothetical protein